MNTLHRKLHLQHHRHTGRVLHHSHTSFRSLFIIFAIAAMCMGGISYINHAAADELMSVSAVVHVPKPTSPPTIARPLPNSTLPTGDTAILGSCPIVSPQPYIAIVIDGKSVGTAVCNAVNDFSFSTSLTTGDHEIVAVPYSIDNDVGPASSPVHVQSQGTMTTASTVSLVALSPAATISEKNVVTWSGILKGDRSSYTILMEWGDGTYDSFAATPGKQQFTHHYARLASYNITTSYRDNANAYHYQQYAANAIDATALAAYNASVSDMKNAASTSSTVTGLYGLFMTLVCLTAIVRLHATPFAYAPIRIGHHGQA